MRNTWKGTDPSTGPPHFKDITRHQGPAPCAAVTPAAYVTFFQELGYAGALKFGSNKHVGLLNENQAQYCQKLCVVDTDTC